MRGGLAVPMRRGAIALACAAALLVLGAEPGHTAGGDDPAARPAPGAHVAILQYARGPGARAEQTKLRLARRLARLGLRARGFERLPMLVVRGPAALLARAARLPEVLYAHPGGRRLSLRLDRSVPLVYGGDPAPLWAAGLDGRGVTVAVMDTGVDGTHPDLLPRMKANVLFALSEQDQGIGSVAPLSLAQPCPGPCNTDYFGHGTHVAGIVAAAGSAPLDALRGTAPDAQIVGLAISRTATANDFFALAGFDYVLAHPELGIAAINNSWGGLAAAPFDATDPIQQATRMLHDAGIAVVFAVGNDGAAKTPRPGAPAGSSDCDASDGELDCRVDAESVAPWVIGVAASDRVAEGGAGAQRPARFSSRGDPAPVTYPDGATIEHRPVLAAPGTAILSTGSAATVLANPLACPALGGAERCLQRTPVQTALYTAASGTSMAAPHVAGAIAVLQGASQARLGRRLTPDEVRRVLVDGAVPMEADGRRFEPWEVGAGMLSIPGSLRALKRLAAPEPPPNAPGEPPPPPPPPDEPQRPAPPPPLAAGDVRITQPSRRVARRVRRLAGRASGAVARVELSLTRRGPGRCARLAPGGRLAATRCAGLPRWLTARGTASWTVRLRRPLPAGRYLLSARAVTAEGVRGPVATLAFRAR